MKNLNWLVKLLFYKHTEKEAKLPKKTTGIFYEVGFVDQIHSNLCTNASESMLSHFSGKPFATMTINPRGYTDGAPPNPRDYHSEMISMDAIQTTLKKSGPFIMSLPLKYGVYHSVVVTGCTNKKIIYNDPLTGGHKMMSISKLKDLCSENLGQVEIAKACFFDKSILASKVKTTLPDSPPNIIPKDHQEFFSLDKMDNPCDAILNFLKDYSKFSLWSLGRHHKKEVSDFVENNKGKSLPELLINLTTTFQKDNLNPKGELCKRLLTIEKMMNKEPTPELEKSMAPSPIK